MKYRRAISDKVLWWLKKAKPFSPIPMNLTTKEAFKRQCQSIWDDIERMEVALVNKGSTRKTRICVTVMTVEGSGTYPTVGLITTVHAVVCKTNWLNNRKYYVLTLAEDGSIQKTKNFPDSDKVTVNVNGSLETLTVRRFQCFSFYV